MEGHEPTRNAADAKTAENLKHLASLIDRGVPLNLKVNGRRVALPADANFAIDLERDPRSGCVKVDLRWSLPAGETRPDPARSEAANDVNSAAAERANGRTAPARRGNPDTAGENARRGPHIRLKALITAPRI